MASTLTSRDRTPIAQLNPDLPGQSERVVSGEVTITWPYNSVTKTTAFLVAEPDIRLRRTKGQVRVELHGPSAKAFSSSGIGAGDEVTFSLDSAQWAKDESPGRVPGARLDWQLLFNQKLSLQAKFSDSDEPKHIDIDHPETEPEVTSPVVEEPMIVEPDLQLPQATPLVRKISEYTNEYPSPAFMKRARISYGSLFEGGLDIFEEDGGIVGKGRKRSRFGRDSSSAWRYSSKSPSPEPEPVAQSTMDEDSMTDTQHEPSPKPSPKPQMTDEGCQTTDDFTTSHVAQTEPSDGQALSEVPPSPRPETEEQTAIPVDNGMVNEVQQSSPDPAGSVEAAASSLFAISKPINPGFSMFGNIPTTPVSRNIDLADQVRFGFSHIPQITETQAVKDGSIVAEQRDSPVRQPEAPPAVKFADMESYLDAAEEEMETAEDHPMSPQPPNIEEFDRGRWEVHDQSPSYNNAEGGHFEANALIDGTRVGAVEESQLHPDSMQPEMVPEGFRSYGTQEKSPHIANVDNADDAPVAPSQNEPRPEGETLLHVGTQRLVDDEDRVGEDDAEYDEDDYVIEDGDYDQRTYNVPDDDDEGLSQEHDELEQETAERYGEGDVYSEDEEQEYDEKEYPGGEYEEGNYDSEGYEESEGGYESDGNYYRQSPGAAVAATSGEPVVISLLSDSEDEDEAPAPPPKRATPDIQSDEEETREDKAIAVGVSTMSGFQAAEPVTAAGPIDESDHASEDELDPEDEDDLEDDHDLENEQNLEDEHDLEDEHGPENEYDINRSENQTQPNRDPAYSDNVNHETSQPQVSAAEMKEAGGEPTDKSPVLTKDGDEESEEEWDEEEDGEGEEEKVDVGEDELIMLSDDSDYEPEPEDEMTSEELEESGSGAPGSPELGEEILVVEDDEQNDKENAAPEANKDTSEVAPEVIEEPDQAEVTNDDIEIIEVEDEDEVDQEVDHPVAISEPDTARTPMDLEEIASDAEQEVPMEVEQGSEAAHIDSEMREASPEPDGDDESVMDVEPSGHEAVAAEPAALVGEDAEMTDIPVTVGTHSALDVGDSRDDHMDVSDTEMTQHEQPTSEYVSKDNQVVEEGLPKESETAIQHPATEHPAAGVFSPPMTQQADIESFSETAAAESSVISNKNERPLPLLTPTQSFIATETVSQFSVMEEHTGSSSKVVITEATHHSAFVLEHVLDSSPFTGHGHEGSQPNEVSELLTKDSEADEVEEIPAESQEAAMESVAEEVPAVAARTPSPEVVETSQLEDEEQVADGKPIASETSFTSPLTRSQTRSAQTPRASKSRSVQEEITVSSPYSETEERVRAQLQEEMEAARRESSPDFTISLARQSAAAKKSKKGVFEPVRISPRVTRGRSNSLQMSVTSEVEEDPSISFARAALASPSKQHVEPPAEAPAPSTAALKSELTKGLRKLPECVSLKNLKNHVDKQANVVVIVVSQPTDPTRAKKGPREYMMSFNVTDPSYAPLHIVEVLLYRPHKESLPIVKPGDAILLQNFEIKALSNKGFGLRSSADSAWAVYEEVLKSEDGAAFDAEAEEPPPQIKGPPVEDYQEYSGYMTTLKAWYRSLDETAQGKLEKAVKKFEEIGAESSQSQSKK